jgi:hypothetical protein
LMEVAGRPPSKRTCGGTVRHQRGEDEPEEGKSNRGVQEVE